MRYLFYLTFFFAPSFLFAQSATGTSDDNAPVINKINDSTYIINNKIVLNSKTRSISFPAKINKINNLIEVVLCTSIGKGYESFLVTEVTPVELQTSLLLLGYQSLENKLVPDKIYSQIVKSKYKKADSVYVYIQWKDSNKVNTQRIENFIWDVQNKSYLKPVSWFFNGLLTNKDGKIISNNEISMIVTNYDCMSILSVNYKTKLNNDISGIHTTVEGEGIYGAKMDKIFLDKEVNLIIKPAADKKNFFRKRAKFIKKL